MNNQKIGNLECANKQNAGGFTDQQAETQARAIAEFFKI